MQSLDPNRPYTTESLATWTTTTKHAPVIRSGTPLLVPVIVPSPICRHCGRRGQKHPWRGKCQRLLLVVAVTQSPDFRHAIALLGRISCRSVNASRRRILPTSVSGENCGIPRSRRFDERLQKQGPPKSPMQGPRAITARQKAKMGLAQPPFLVGFCAQAIASTRDLASVPRRRANGDMHSRGSPPQDRRHTHLGRFRR